MTAVARYFDVRAAAFDRVYQRHDVVTRLLRPGPARGRGLAVSVVRRHAPATVLDVGCGPGRVAEAVLDAGATSYVGIDVSARMLELARNRLRGRDVELLHGDAFTLRLPQPYDVVLALGVFEYLAEPQRAARWLHEHCRVALVASFTRRDTLKAPLRRLYYAAHGCRVVNYSEPEVDAMLRRAGFADVVVSSRMRRGFLVCAAPGSPSRTTDDADLPHPAHATG